MSGRPWDVCPDCCNENHETCKGSCDCCEREEAPMTNPKSAEEIRARLNEIAPWNPGEMNAGQLARWFGMEAQVVWARMLDSGHGIDPRDIGTLHGFFAAASLLLQLRQYAPERADEMARYISAELEDPDGVGEKLWQYHGGCASEVADLARRLATLTEVDANGHLQVREPASP